VKDNILFLGVESREHVLCGLSAFPTNMLVTFFDLLSIRKISIHSTKLFLYQSDKPIKIMRAKSAKNCALSYI